jgi:hypothetical protein
VIDVDDTSRCPVADACATCGAVTDLHICTYTQMLGVCCLTVCGCCEDSPPSMSPAAAQLAVLAHCEHLGCDLDQMADALDRETR